MAVVVDDMVDPGEVADVVMGMRTGGSGEIDCESREGLLTTVCNECCDKLSRYMLEMIRTFHSLETDLDMHMILGVLGNRVTLSKAPKDPLASRGPPEEYLSRFGFEAGS